MSANTHEAWARYWNLRAAQYEAEAVRDECQLAAEIADPMPLPTHDSTVAMLRRHVVLARQQAEACRGYAEEETVSPAA